jgi:hypothetical protein
MQDELAWHGMAGSPAIDILNNPLVLTSIKHQHHHT